ncbi:hypothetical protein [Neobacillus sp. PS3-40]|nr:hypothetical protein [Neobacillus sp. PS3-40]WML43195.1 hypothetical protein RCG20_15505 [Neobacillus sp. PS3-40]
MNQEHLMKFTIRKMEREQKLNSKGKTKKQPQKFIRNCFKKLVFKES